MLEDILRDIKERGGLTKMFLDYDGTLVDITSQPELAIPDRGLIDLLVALKSRLPLYLVTGRDLDGFVSLIGKGFNIIAMHGSERMSEDGEKSFIEGFDYYRKETRKMANKYSYLEEEFPGLRIIDKRGGLQFHYYNVARNRLDDLEYVISNIREDGFELYSGKFVYELRVKGVNKGTAMLKLIGTEDLVLFAGDDRTDEEAFEKLSKHVTIKVGDGETAARYRLPTPSMMRAFLETLLKKQNEMFRKGL